MKTADAIISNCVINLSPEREAFFRRPARHSSPGEC